MGSWPGADEEPASLGMLLSALGAESHARSAGRTSPHVGAGYLCVTGQIVPLLVIMKIMSAAVNYRTNFSNPKSNTGVGQAFQKAYLRQPFLEGTGDHDGVQSISLPQSVQANAAASATVRGAQTIHPATW